MKVLISSFAAASMLGLFSSSVTAAPDDAKAQELLKKGGCVACHSVDKKIVGPAFKDVAAKHKGEADAAATLEKSVRGGSKGIYGAIPMPPLAQGKLSDAELHDVVEWVLTR